MCTSNWTGRTAGWKLNNPAYNTGREGGGGEAGGGEVGEFYTELLLKALKILLFSMLASLICMLKLNESDRCKFNYPIA